ncbi:MAG: SufD family Fe-S cluster assembly protein [Candidatus Peribacteraceae bacterium]|nr:SufD family Fe-S cluster assembly protein [Candidatus Peribacteraceae bacterium]
MTHTQSSAISLVEVDGIALACLSSDPSKTVFELKVPAAWTSKEPLRLMVDARAWDRVQLVIHIGKGAEVFISEMIESKSSSKGDWNYEVSINLEANAQCQFASLQQLSSNIQPQMKQHSTLGANAQMQWHNTTLGGSNVQHELRSEATGVDAISSVDWIFYAKGTEKQHLSAVNAFLAPGGGGEVTMKGVAEQKGHTVCNGMIEIGPNGGRTDTYLTEEVLMLDASSMVDAIPGLEIKTNDVKASHSATVSRVTEEDLFYFAARGIESLIARKMYVEGFLADLTERIGDLYARKLVLEAIEQKYSSRAFAE